ncbi:hypothetical protein FBEOM_3286 [Fusarium beomiforme]|uniref:Uncharacterized protein n=1 Tax=Fusarium beomiforme TaxID=44412 RepID=A0A9P5E1K8_9HYPO|nr:hypothetical protein FBEOM_3286 [Fusarium beomiforme]
MSNQQKRPASDDAHPQRAAKRGSQARMTPYERALLQARRQVEEHPLVSSYATATFAHDMSKGKPPGWTSRFEDAVAKMWHESPVKPPSSKINNHQHSPLRCLWRTSIQLLNVTPVQMISPLYTLRYQPDGKKDAGNLIFSKKFSKALESLMVHPCFQEQADHLVQVLQFAVACRLDDRNVWPVPESSTTECPALKLFYEELEACGQSGAPQPIHRMHASARERALANGDRISEWSEFLHHVGETVSNNKVRRPRIDEEFRHEMDWPVLPLTLWDLKILIQAVDTMKFRNREWRYTAENALSAWNEVSNGRSGAPTIKQLPEFYELATKNVFRQMLLPSSIEDDSSNAASSDKEGSSDEESSDEDIVEELIEDTTPQTDRLRHDDFSDEEEGIDNTEDGSEPPVDTPHHTHSSPSNEHSYEDWDDGMGDNFYHGNDADEESQVASTVQLPSRTSSEARRNLAASPESASLDPPSTHHEYLYKCLKLDFRSMQQDMASLRGNFDYLCQKNYEKDREIESLRAEIDRLSAERGQDREDVLVLDKERLEILDALQDERKKRRSLEKKANELQSLIRPSGKPNTESQSEHCSAIWEGPEAAFDNVMNRSPRIKIEGTHYGI